MKRAFTLLEILIAVVILGILATLIISQFDDADDGETAKTSAVSAVEKHVGEKLESPSVILHYGKVGDHLVTFTKDGNEKSFVVSDDQVTEEESSDTSNQTDHPSSEPNAGDE